MAIPPASDQQSTSQTQVPLSTSGMAVAALILGLIGCIPPLGIVALILGLIAIGRIDNPANNLTGKGLAIAGTIIGGATTFLIIPLVLMIGILLPTIGAARNTALRMKSNARVRGICAGLIQYSQGNQDQYPGLGRVDDLTVEGRYQILLDSQFIAPEYLISPVEAHLKQPAYGGTLTTKNYSFALPQIPESGGRRNQWAATLNFEAPIVSDRNTGTGPGSAARSIHSDTEWRGSVAYNDNHTNFETNHVLSYTRFGDVKTTNDDLFAPAGNDDAYMIYSGNE